jgi:hypothetical protein
LKIALSSRAADVETERWLDDFEPTPLPVNLLYAARRFLPIKVRAFLDVAAPRLKAQLARG